MKLPLPALAINVKIMKTIHIERTILQLYQHNKNVLYQNDAKFINKRSCHLWMVRSFVLNYSCLAVLFHHSVFENRTKKAKEFK